MNLSQKESSSRISLFLLQENLAQENLPKENFEPRLMDRLSQHTEHSSKRMLPCKGGFQFDEQMIRLYPNSQMFFVFDLFAKRQGEMVSKNELICRMYQIKNIECVSDRLQRSVHHNLIKTISRARALARSRFSKNEEFIRWFPFDPYKRSWSLFRYI